MMKAFPKSEEILERARKILPGGVNSPVRSFQSVGGKAFVASHGQGPYIFDIDRNRYIDLVCSWGPLIHGHAHPEILEALRRRMEAGLSFGVSSEIELQLSEKISKAVPSMEMLRLVNSGTEACMSVIRLARAYTGRRIIVKFEGHYHGHSDSFLVAAGSGLATLGVSSSAGVDQTQTIVLPFNDVEALELTFNKFGQEIAAVILEVVAGNMGLVLPDLSFLQKLRSITQSHGSLLIFDEVITGFRLSWGGAQGLYGITPELSCFGKTIGGGLPVGAYGGKREIMSLVSPLGPVYQAGTLSGNPLAAQAGLTTLEMIEREADLFYQRLDSLTAEWASLLKSHIEHKGYPVSVVQCGSLLSVFFRPEPPRNFKEVKESDIGRFQSFFWKLIDLGVYFPPSAFETCFISAAHDEKVIEELSKACISALDACYKN